MKKTLLFIFLINFTSNSFCQSVDDIINKYIAAIGGMEKLSSIQTIKISGRNIWGSREVPFVQIIKRNTGAKFETTTQGMVMQNGFDGKIAWRLNPFTGGKEAEKMPELQTRGMKKSLDIDGPLVNYKEKGNAVELIGKEDFEGSEVFKIKLTDEYGDITYYSIDADSYLILKTRNKTMYQGNVSETETVFGNYRNIDSVLRAFSMESKGVGQEWVSKAVIDKVEINIAVSDSIFKMPVTDKKPETKK